MSKYFLFDSNNGIFEQSYTTLINNSIKISHRILFHCASITDSFLAIGCNTGNIYVFNIENNRFQYYSNIISNDIPIDNLLFDHSKSYLACSNIKFQIFIYKFNLTNEPNQLIRQFDSTYNSPIYCLLWDEECTRLFCGYKNGTIDSILIPQQAKDIFQVPVEIILKSDKQSIVQMDIIKDTLLVSTNEKVVLVNMQTKFSVPIGTKQRSGQYGACFWYGNSKVLKVVAARPNYRLWIAACDGTVEETQQYKNWIYSSKYKIRYSDEELQGTGQFSWLYSIKNNLILAGDSGGLLLLIDLMSKLCLITIDCGTNLSKTFCSKNGLLILTLQKELVNLSVLTVTEAILEIINENSDPKYAIDLFLNLSKSLETVQTGESKSEIRQIYNDISPSLLTRLVELSAEMAYRFVETNKLQVDITDDDEYQKMYYSIKEDTVVQMRMSNTSSTDIFVESSTDLSSESNNSHQSLLNKIKSSETIKTMVKAPNLLQSLYDKTSQILSQMDVLSPSNSELHLSMVDSYSETNSRENDSKDDHSMKMNSKKIVQNVGSKINVMELEANVYITWERMKHLSTTDDTNTNYNFVDSLNNFCESWLSLNLQHWQNLFFDQLQILNLSSTFPNFSAKSKEGLEISNRSLDNFVPHEELNYLYSNSWCTPINYNSWMKPLFIPEKISQMASTLLTHCFTYKTFTLFPEYLSDVCEMANMEKPQNLINSSEISNEIYDCTENEKCIQTNGFFETKVLDVGEPYNFPDLLDLLDNEIWPIESDCSWIRSMILMFHAEINLKDMRNWISSCIPHNVWLTIFFCFKEIYSGSLSKEDYQLLLNKPQIELDRLLFNCLCFETMESLVLADQIISCMKKRESVNWKIIVESENLGCRDVLHISIKHNLDLSDYIIILFSNINGSTKFYTRNKLIEFIYFQPDVLISFIYVLSNNLLSKHNEHKTCSCGLITVYASTGLPDNMNGIVMDILKWGSGQNVFQSEPKLLKLLTKICIDTGFHQGYIELLVGTRDITKLILIGLQTANMAILEKIKDCNTNSPNSLKQALETMIGFRRKQIENRCLNCEQFVENSFPINPISWRDLGDLMFNKLLHAMPDEKQMQRNIINMLKENELSQVQEYLVVSIKNIINSKKIVVKNQMLNFIKSEMNQMEDSAKLTEMYLNIYTMNQSELCGANWGKILTQNMSCNICGFVLLDKTVSPNDMTIVSFSCSHTFHRRCIQDIGCEYFCVICG